MIPEAREVHLSRKDRKVLEACCRSPVTLQRDLKRARIVLLAADGRSTRSIAKEVGVQPRIVSLWRHRYADHGLEGLQDKPRPGKHRRKDLAAAQRYKSVAEDHRRCQIQRRHRGHPSAGKPRRLITSSPKIPHSSQTWGPAPKGR